MTSGWDLTRYLENVSDHYLTFESHEPGKLNGMYRDTYGSLVLYRRGEVTADAVIGVELLNKNMLTIKQIQASQEVRRELLPAQWERKLVRATINWAKDKGYKRVAIQRAENNGYYNQYVETERNKRLRIRYNVTAKRMGFALDEKLDAWILDINL